jgi:hypothetical protein
MRRAVALLAVLVGLASGAVAQSPMPSPVITAFDNTGDVIAGAKLCTYVAGSSSPAKEGEGEPSHHTTRGCSPLTNWSTSTRSASLRSRNTTPMPMPWML